MSNVNNVSKERNIKLIALDLDGTTLKNDKEISKRTVDALEAAHDKGVHVVIATGRGFKSVPDNVKSVKGIEYVVCANGANIRRAADGELIYQSLIGEKETMDIVEYLKQSGRSAEVFIDGRAYIGQKEYDDVVTGRVTFRSKEYVTKTRIPVDDVVAFAEKHAGEIENISIFFENIDEKPIIWEELSVLQNVTVTSSFPYNIEIGGEGTSKASALAKLAEQLGVKKEEMMCCGDSLNDMAMLKVAGLAVAMANAEPAVKGAADYVTDTNENDGVAKAVEKFVLGM